MGIRGSRARRCCKWSATNETALPKAETSRPKMVELGLPDSAGDDRTHGSDQARALRSAHA